MATITAIEPQAHNPHRVNVHLDEGTVLGLSRVLAAWLAVGQDLSEERLAALRIDEARERAYQQAMLFLGVRARSEAEIRRNLRRHEIPEEVIEYTLERLRADRLADDRQFAANWVENRSTFRPRSRRALTAELRQKGLSEQAAQAALEGVDDAALAYQAGLKRARRLEALDWEDFRRKLSDHLARRGFPYEVVAPVVSRIWNEAHTEPHLVDEEENV